MRVLPDAASASRAVAEGLAERARTAVEARGRFAVALAGGTGPEGAYRLLGDEPLRSAIPWEGVHLFWGDERCVPPAHPRSNFRMALHAFVSRVPIPPENVHRMPGEARPADGARRYAEDLEELYGPGVPRFDLIHLGLGPDAHTASLFPFSPALHERETTVAAALHPTEEWRLTLTVPVLNAAQEVEFLAPGAGKADVVRRVIEGPLDPLRLPAQLVRPTSGPPTWVLDADAAARLKA